MSRSRRQGPIATARVLVPALMVAVLATGCSGDLSLFGDDDPTPVPVATDAPEESTAPRFELRFVRANAPACANVWSPGRRLPVNYEWCTDADGGAVAGPRVGSCEVVSHEDRLYAVPGYRIRAANAGLADDPRFRRALTSCGRRVAAGR